MSRLHHRPAIRALTLVVLPILLVAGAAGCGERAQERDRSASAPRDTQPAVDTVNVDAAFEAAASDEVLLVDVREPAEWQAGHARDAVHVPLAAVGGQLAMLERRAAGRPVWFVCRSGSRSAQAAQVAVDGGIAQVASVDGGMGAWVAAGHPIVPPDGTIA